MGRILGGAVAFSMASLLATPMALADGGVSVEAEPCPEAAGAIPALVQERVFGQLGKSVRAYIRVRGAAGELKVIIEVQRPDGSNSSRALMASSCAEAVELASSVTALALSGSPSDSGAAVTGDSMDAAPSDELSPHQSANAATARLRTPIGSIVAAPSEAPAQKDVLQDTVGKVHGFQVDAVVGMDVDGARNPPLIGLGFSHFFHRSSIRLGGWVGLRNGQDEVSGETVESRRLQHFAGRLDYCYAADHRRFIQGCAGAELAAQDWSTWESTSNYQIREDGLRFMLGATASALFSYRRGPVQPTLSLGMRLPVVHPEKEPKKVGFQSFLGAAVPFL